MDIQELEATVRALERRLRRAEDVQSIERLKARYGELADSRYADGAPRADDELARIAREIAALFTVDAVWDGGPALGSCRGRAAIEARFARPTLRFSWHYFVKPRIEVEDDRARARWDVLAPCTTRDGVPHWLAGVEEDEYRRVEGRWLHSRLTLRVIFLAPHASGWSLGSKL